MNTIPQDKEKATKAALKKEENIKSGMKVFIGALAGGFLGAVICLLWATFFISAETFTDRVAGMEIGMWSGIIVGGAIGSYFHKIFSLIAAALGWAFGMDIDV